MPNTILDTADAVMNTTTILAQTIGGSRMIESTIKLLIQESQTIMIETTAILWKVNGFIDIFEDWLITIIAHQAATQTMTLARHVPIRFSELVTDQALGIIPCVLYGSIFSTILTIQLIMMKKSASRNSAVGAPRFFKPLSTRNLKISVMQVATNKITQKAMYNLR